jgi:glycine cleavage system transcriptional repressor
MKAKMIMTAVGKDRPGIVAAVSKVLFETGCNIEDSSMTQMGGEFAMMLLVATSEKGSPESVQEKLAPIGAEWKLHLSYRLLQEDDVISVAGEVDQYLISVYGADHPGILYGIAELLAHEKVNVTDVNTRLVGEKDKEVYCMLLEVVLPQGASPEQVEARVKEKAESLKVDVTFRAIEKMEL